MWYLIPTITVMSACALIFIRHRRKAIGPDGADRGEFDEFRAWWMEQFIDSLCPADATTMRPPIDVPIKLGVERITSRTFGLVEGTIFYREPSGTCDIMLKKYHQADDGSRVLEWSKLVSYRASSAVPAFARHIIDLLTGKTVIDKSAPLDPPAPA